VGEKGKSSKPWVGGGKKKPETKNKKNVNCPKKNKGQKKKKRRHRVKLGRRKKRGVTGCFGGRDEKKGIGERRSFWLRSITKPSF